jgi:predicted ATPase
MVSVIGEAGLGKSRLIEEARKSWMPHEPGGEHSIWDVPVWQCQSYDTARPYAQYRRMIGQVAGVADIDPPDIVTEKLTRISGLAALEWRDVRLRVWRNLFGVSQQEQDALEGEGFKLAVEELVPAAARAAGSVPRLMLFEDMHWCDEASMDLIIELARIVDDVPFLFLFAFRPDRNTPAWRLRRWLETEYPHRSSEVVLSPLTDAESGALVDELVPAEDRSDALRTEILERSEGNPLFAEEIALAVVRHRADSGTEVAIPSTLRSLITARVDMLDEDSRRTLQLASVLGRTFREPVLRAVSGGDGVELERRLGTLERAGLIEETARSPEREYSFHHSLTQEAVYSTIPLRGRRELHQSIGEALEVLYRNRLDEFAPLLADHFEEAGADEPTLAYATMAGDHAARLYANAEAVTHYTKALEAAHRLGADDTTIHDLYMSRGRTLELEGRHEEAAANSEQLRVWGEAVD